VEVCSNFVNCYTIQNDLSDSWSCCEEMETWNGQMLEDGNSKDEITGSWYEGWAVLNSAQDMRFMDGSAAG
jgi:hypothetical protein